jgi:hypothetical protein
VSADHLAGSSQFLGELEAGPRRGRIGIDGVIQKPETVFVAQLFILAADVGDFAQVERQPQGIQRRPPQLALGHGTAEHGERVGLLAGIDLLRSEGEKRNPPYARLWSEKQLIPPV